MDALKAERPPSDFGGLVKEGEQAFVSVGKHNEHASQDSMFDLCQVKVLRISFRGASYESPR